LTGPRILAVESKCVETFKTHEAHFAPAYRQVLHRLADATWRAEFDRLIEDPRRYRFLDAAQLFKHYLGLRNQFPHRPITLAYLYWAPTNAADVAPCAIHAAELREFASCMNDPRVQFVGMSYAQVWDDWSGEGRPGWLREHVAALRQRFDLSI